MTPPLRTVAITNRHPFLRIDRRATIRIFHLLDAHAATITGLVRRRILRSASEHLPGVPPGELSVVFLTDTALARLHADFLDDPAATDVITFGGEEVPGLPDGLGTAGEICVSADAAARHAGIRLDGRSSRVTSQPDSRFAASAGQRAPALPDAFSAELTLYLVHGWLHLAGYDDLVPARKRAMRRAEARAMSLLRRYGCRPAFAVSRRPRR